jgi:hypothetical protein
LAKVGARCRAEDIQVEESRQQGLRAQAAILGRGDSAEDGENLGSFRRGEEIALLVERERDGGPSQRAPDGVTFRVGEGQDEDVARAKWPVAVAAAQAKRGRRIEQAAQLADDGVLDRGMGVGRAQGLFLGGKTEHYHRCAGSRGIVQQAQVIATTTYRMVVGDAACAAEEFRTLREEQVGRFDEPLRRAEVAIEHQALAPCVLQGPRRSEISFHVGTAESVDGLLGIANYSQAVAVAVVVTSLDEDAPENRPLHVVGVLKLIDQGVAIASAQGFA